mgnify:CR=1 FL=1
MSWAPWRALNAQWTAPVAKAPPPPPVSPPPGLTQQYRSEKRRKLQDHTIQVLREPWKLGDEILQIQEECFQDYENTIETLNSKLQNRDTCIYEQKQNMTNIQRQLLQKNTQIRKKNNEIAILRSNNLTLQTQIDSVNLRMATEASENEEKIEHYKSLVKGLQKTAENAEESAQYLRHMKKMLFEYESGETLEDSLKTADRKCSICMENHANIVCLPCMHMEFCHGCAIDINSLSSSAFSTNKRVVVDSKCPRCKGTVDEILYIFT